MSILNCARLYIIPKQKGTCNSSACTQPLNNYSSNIMNEPRVTSATPVLRRAGEVHFTACPPSDHRRNKTLDFTELEHLWETHADVHLRQEQLSLRLTAHIQRLLSSNIHVHSLFANMWVMVVCAKGAEITRKSQGSHTLLPMITLLFHNLHSYDYCGFWILIQTNWLTNSWKMCTLSMIETVNPSKSVQWQ